MTRGLLVPEFGPIRAVEFRSLHDMQELVGGYVEAVPWVFRSKPMLYVNEDGKRLCRPNRAVVVDGELQDILFGPILACGFDQAACEDADISEDEAKAVHGAFGFMYPTNLCGQGSGYVAYCETLLRLADGD